ncbi:MAG: helix-turn-helix transcriptional regulator [Nitrosomonadales bacterium]|nr:helix-turn-helix transcriptional regulator [Nitrosomonadales bacterium]
MIQFWQRNQGAIIPREEKLSEIIGQIYQAGTDAACADDLAPTIASAFDSESCVVYFRRNASDGKAKMPTLAGYLSGTANNDEKALIAYASHYHDLDEWYIRGWKKGTSAIVLGQELISTNAVLRTEWTDYLRMTEIIHCLGAHFVIEGDLLGLVGAHRPHGRKSFDEQDKQKMALLVPHIQRALQLRERLAMDGQRSTLTLDVLDGLAVGVVLVASDCRILFANQTAELALCAQHGFKVCKARLQPLDSSDARAFELMVSEAAKTGAGQGASSGGTLYVTLPGNAKLPVMVSPMKSGEAVLFPAIPAAMVIFSLPDGNLVISEQVLARCYGLTAAEARLYSALIAGQELADYAEAQKVGVGTVKTHLKSIFDKTGCHRQVDLVRNALSDPVLRLKLP